MCAEFQANLTIYPDCETITFFYLLIGSWLNLLKPVSLANGLTSRVATLRPGEILYSFRTFKKREYHNFLMKRSPNVSLIVRQYLHR